VVPSTFNIFRDSLRHTSQLLQATLIENLPELNLNEVSESESEADDEEVLPLDFRTAMLEKDSRVVIQVKPLAFKEYIDDEEQSKSKHVGTDAYLERAKKEAFKEEEGAIMIDPDINIKDKFRIIDLPCNKETRINNAFNAPVRQGLSGRRAKPVPVSGKTYESDAGTSEVEEGHIDSTQVHHVSQVKPAQFKKPESTDYKKPGIVSEILEANRKQLAAEDEDRLDMLGELEKIAEEAPEAKVKEEEGSDFAPVSPYADSLTVEQQQEQAEEARKKEFLKAVNAISSASETDEAASGTEAKRQAVLGQKSAGAKVPAQKPRKVKFYKGQPVMSDTEGHSPSKKQGTDDKMIHDPDESSESKSSHGSADEYFNEQRKKLRKAQNV
jgi:hypothetical protein